MSKVTLMYLALLVALLTFVLYGYQSSQPPDEEKIEACNEQVEGMPEGNQNEINRAINQFVECLEN